MHRCLRYLWEESDFDGTAVRTEDGKEVTLRQIALKATAGICSELQVVKEYSSPDLTASVYGRGSRSGDR